MYDSLTSARTALVLFYTATVASAARCILDGRFEVLCIIFGPSDLFILSYRLRDTLSWQLSIQYKHYVCVFTAQQCY